ncbi:MAG: recombinase family protein [Dehalococcoidia bacterium]|nr:recombinase family protein [Dehalococcoidia bacterium]
MGSEARGPVSNEQIGWRASTKQQRRQSVPSWTRPRRLFWTRLSRLFGLPWKTLAVRLKEFPRLRRATEKKDSMKKYVQPLTPVALYARVSSDRLDVDLSVSAQLRAIKDYAKANGYSVAREYVDEAESGRVANRPSSGR